MNGALGWHQKGQCQQEEDRSWSAEPYQMLGVENPNRDLFVSFYALKSMLFSLPSPIFGLVKQLFSDRGRRNWLDSNAL